MPLRDTVHRQPLAMRVDCHRRRTLRGLALFAALAVMCAGCDWQMFGYGPAHTSFNPTESAISVGNVAGLSQRYPTNSFSNALGCSSPSYPGPCAPPAVAQGTVYVGAGRDFVARDAGTGILQWSAHTDASIHSSPAVVDGVVYVASWTDFTANTNRLYAFDASGTTNCSGSPKVCTPLWTASSGSGAVSSPAVANGVVYVTASLLSAFDAAGTTNCSGTPKSCTTVWVPCG